MKYPLNYMTISLNSTNYKISSSQKNSAYANESISPQNYISASKCNYATWTSSSKKSNKQQPEQNNNDFKTQKSSQPIDNNWRPK